MNDKISSDFFHIVQGQDTIRIPWIDLDESYKYRAVFEGMSCFDRVDVENNGITLILSCS